MSKEWDNWKTVYGTVKEDSHHAEWVDIETGEVVKEATITKLNHYDINNLKGKSIHRNDIGDAFCSVDWSKH